MKRLAVGCRAPSATLGVALAGFGAAEEFWKELLESVARVV